MIAFRRNVCVDLGIVWERTRYSEDPNNFPANLNSSVKPCYPLTSVSAGVSVVHQL